MKQALGEKANKKLASPLACAYRTKITCAYPARITRACRPLETWFFFRLEEGWGDKEIP